MADTKKDLADALGGQFTNNQGRTVTGNANKDPKYEGGHYVSTGDKANHTTDVYDKDGKLQETKVRGNG